MTRRDLDARGPDRFETARLPRGDLDRGRFSAGRRLRASEAVLLGHVGTFRAVSLGDLERYAYQGDSTTCRSDVRKMSARRLADAPTRVDLSSGQREIVVTLTEEGARLARDCVVDPRQAVYSGVSRPLELSHDLGVYRMYHAEAARLEREGSRVRRVVLEHELRRELMGAVKRGGREAASREQLAERLALTVVSQRVQIPDLRIEYETPMGEPSRVDLELATRHYAGSTLAAKAQAGFRIYAEPADVESLSAVLDERDLLVEILSW